MPGIITAKSDVSPEIQGYYDRNLLERVGPALHHGRFGQVRPLPKKQGARINFRRYGSLAVATTPLTEGVTPSGKKLTSSTIYAVVKQYGDFVTITDWVSMTGLDNTLLEAGEILGDQAGETMDILDRDVLLGCTTVRYANGEAARTSIATALGKVDLDSVVRTLEGNNAKKIRTMITAGKSVATVGIRAAFIGITHTHCRKDIEALPGFTPVKEYASQKDVLPDEIGEAEGIRFILTTAGKITVDAGAAVGSTGLVSTSASQVDVYHTILLGQNAYGVVPLQKKSIKNIVKAMGSAGTEDPLDQRATSGWKTATTTKILNDEFMAVIEHGVTSV